MKINFFAHKKMRPTSIPSSFWLVLLLLISLTTVCYAQEEMEQRHVDIDTVTLGGVHPGLNLQTLSHFIYSKLDTMIWGGSDGASIIRFHGTFFDQNGECRMATEGSLVTQTTFTIYSKDGPTAAKNYIALGNLLTNIYGGPDETYANGMRLTRWKGAHQNLTLKTADGNDYVSIVLQLLPSRPQQAKMPKLKNGKE